MREVNEVVEEWVKIEAAIDSTAADVVVPGDFKRTSRQESRRYRENIDTIWEQMIR